MPPGTASKEILKKRKTLEKLASALRSNVTVDGFYYPLGPDLRPFPEKSIFAQLLELLGQANSPESQSDKRSLWKRILFWRKNVYANDESGWILRETPRGWEIVPDALWEKEPEFAIELDEDAGAGRLPPSAGWTSVADGSAADLTIRIPLSCRNSLVVRNSPAKEAGADAPFTRKDDWVFENEFVEALSPPTILLITREGGLIGIMRIHHHPARDFVADSVVQLWPALGLSCASVLHVQ